MAQLWRATKGTWEVPLAEVPRFRGNVEGPPPAPSAVEAEEDDGHWWPVLNGRVVRFDDSPGRG